jgi:hypothetical protein
MDNLVSDYIEHLWSEGEGRALASTFLAALQDRPKAERSSPSVVEIDEDMDHQ